MISSEPSKGRAAYRLLRGLPVGLLAFTAGCAGADGAVDGEGVESTTQDISGGSLVGSAENANLPYSAAVKFGTSCSGVKIGDKRFLTAIHCISFQEKTIRVSSARTPGALTPLTVSRLAFHPSYTLAITEPDDIVDLGAYEVAVVDVVEASPDIATLPVTGVAVQPGTYSSAFAPLLIAYGCDTVNPTNTGKKQKVSFPTITHPQIQPASPFEFVHYITEGNSANTCSGDSGGPLAQRTVGGFRTVGVTSGGGRFTRLSNIKEWIDSPAENVFQHQSAGYLMNLVVSREGGVPKVNCAAMESAAGDPIEVRMQQCDGFNGMFTQKYPGWRLRQDSLTGHFSILNRRSSRCLTRDSNTTVTARTCVPGQANQAWRFVEGNLAGPAATTGYPRLHAFRIVNGTGASERCLGLQDESANLGKRVRLDVCSSPLKTHQKWVYSR